MMTADQQRKAIRDALFNGCMADLDARIAAMGGLVPVNRKNVEAAALQFLILHVAAMGYEGAGKLTRQGIAERATLFWSLWEQQRERVVGLIPIREEVDEKLN